MPADDHDASGRHGLVLSSTPTPAGPVAGDDHAGRAGNESGTVVHVTEATTSIGVPVVPVTQPAG